MSNLLPTAFPDFHREDLLADIFYNEIFLSSFNINFNIEIYAMKYNNISLLPIVNYLLFHLSKYHFFKTIHIIYTPTYLFHSHM